MVTHNFLAKKTNSSNEAGFIILTIPIILALFGFFITAMIKDSQPNQFYFETTTQHKMQDLRVALAAYAHRNYRVPCPADPSAVAGARGTEGALDSDDKCADIIGILPFRELGLPESAAKDEWGNYLTYKVSKDFTQSYAALDFEQDGEGSEKTLILKDGDESALHQLCRTPNWVTHKANYVMSDGDSANINAQNMNHNVYKARFCCPSILNNTASLEFKASENAWHNGSTTANLDLDGDGIGDDKVIMSIEALEDEIAMWKPNEYIEERREWAEEVEGAVFAYDALEHDGIPMGDGLGIDRGGSRNGKFFRNAAVFDIQENEENVAVQDFTMTLGDLNESNWYSAMQINLEIVDNEGNFVENVAFVLRLPEAPTGIGELSFSLDSILGEVEQEGFYSTTNGDPEGKRNQDERDAEKLFYESKERLLDALAAADLDLSDVEIGRVKFNASHASLGFSEMKFGSPSVATSQDLIVLNEDNEERLERRNDKSAYGATTVIYDAPINQNFEAAAYALISHGPNGEGAYLTDGTKRDNITDADENEFERRNHESAVEVSDIRKIVSNDGSEVFDDIIIWDSQLTLYNALRNGTCEASQSL